MREVRTIRRKGLRRGSVVRILRDCTPDSEATRKKIQSDLHGDMQRMAEMTIPVHSREFSSER
jgi:hypothetical protein